MASVFEQTDCSLAKKSISSAPKLPLYDQSDSYFWPKSPVSKGPWPLLFQLGQTGLFYINFSIWTSNLDPTNILKPPLSVEFPSSLTQGRPNWLKRPLSITLFHFDTYDHIVSIKTVHSSTDHSLQGLFTLPLILNDFFQKCPL